MKTDELPWFTADAGWFGDNKPVNDFVHENSPKEPYSISDTYWFCVGDPKTGLTVDLYTILRRNMGVAVGAVWIYQGMQREAPMTTEHYNIQWTLPFPTIDKNVLTHPTFGLSFEILEPLKRARVRYRPNSKEVEADFEFEELLPMVTTSKDDHYDQAMWCKGTLRLGDRMLKVDAPGFRDRSWGIQRPEEPLKHPPLGYLWGIVDEGRTAFNLRLGDDPERGESWARHYGFKNQELFHGGWIQLKGELRAIVKASRVTKRDAKNMMKPTEVNVDFEDSAGEKHRLVGVPRSSIWFFPWGNIFNWFEYMDWSLDGMTGNGELQDGAWADFCKRYWE